MIKVSVIVPIYGTEKLIERCANSLFAQTLDGIEFIFIDDCSPDKSVEILSSVIEKNRYRFEEMDWHVRVERMPTNSGQAKVRKHGIGMAHGDYIIHCDSDDWVDASMYKTLYNEAIASSADIVVCDLQTHDGNKSHRIISGCLNVEKSDILRDILYQKIPGSVCNKLTRRELYDKIEVFPDNNLGEDMLLSVQLLYFSNRIVYIRKPYYYYYKNPNSFTRKSTLQSYIDRCYQFDNNVNRIIDFLTSKSEMTYFLKAKNWLEYSVKSSLGNSFKECQSLWRKQYPLVEFKVLFDRVVPVERRRECLKNIIKNYFLFWL